MKKTIKFALLVFAMTFTMNSFSQVNKYQGEASASYGIGVGTFSINRFCVETVHGVRFNPDVFLGLGLGYTSLTKDGSSFGVIPVFANVKGYLPSSRNLKPFGSLDFGYGIGTGDMGGFGGVYISPAIGLSFNKFNISLAYQSQAISDSGVSVTFGAIALKAGVTF